MQGLLGKDLKGPVFFMERKNAIAIPFPDCYNEEEQINMQSRLICVKCPSNGELLAGRKAAMEIFRLLAVYGPHLAAREDMRIWYFIISYCSGRSVIRR